MADDTVKVKKVMIFGGGVAALSAAAALVEHNHTKSDETKVKFEITIMTSDDILGGRASSWWGGKEDTRRFEKDEHDGTTNWKLKSYDFRYWSPDLPLNHGFHAVFAESTYKNFWYTLQLAGLSRDLLLKGDPTQNKPSPILVSNKHELLVHESVTNKVCRLQVHNRNKYPYPFNSHLTESAFEVWNHGGWTLGEIWSFGRKVLQKATGYPTFDNLADLDLHQGITFKKWCRDQGVDQNIFGKMMFKFLFQGTYIAPNEMDATSGLIGLWIILRDKDAAEWFYINGGITDLLMNPIRDYLTKQGVDIRMSRRLSELVPSKDFTTIKYCTSSPTEHKTRSGHAREEYDYYISTLPLDSFYNVLSNSFPEGTAPAQKGPKQDSDKPPHLLDLFPDIDYLKKGGFERDVDQFQKTTAGTVNLQAWFKEPGLLADSRVPNGSYKNVIAGFEPLCVIVDYKNILPMYDPEKKDLNTKFTGSVLEINGSLGELQSAEHYGYFECDKRFKDPDHDDTIDFAICIMNDMAKRYGLRKLKDALKDRAFLEMPDWPDRKKWEGQKIPPFLWKNTDPYNRFFVTGPGTLQHRPWIWRKRYPLSLQVYKRFPPSAGIIPEGYPDNLFIAGDWTRNGFDVPCMEGAARSGRMAVVSIVKKELGIDPTADPTKPDDHENDERLIKVLDPD